MKHIKMKTVENKIAQVAVYCRKSQESEDRQALSIPSQIDECNLLAENHSTELDDLRYFQESRSAKEPGRPEFNRLIQDVEKGLISIIICWKLDRLARNPIDGAAILWLLQQGKIQKIITSGKDYFPTDNHVLLNIEFGMSTQYSIDLSKNVIRGNKKKLELGWLPGLAPAGYLNNLNDPENAIIKDPERFEMIRKAWNLMLTGAYSVPQVLNILNEDWGFRTFERKRMPSKPLSKSSLYNIFNNHFYYGVIVRKEEKYPGKHQPMINEEEFFRVQKILGKKGTTRPQAKQFAFKGYVKCGECNCSITAEDTIKKGGKKYTYYRCTKKKKGVKCSQRYLNKNEMDRQVAEAIESFSIPIEFKDWAIKCLKFLEKKESKVQTKVFDRLTSQFKKVKTRLSKLTYMRLDESLSEEDFLSTQRDLQNEKCQLQTRLANLDSEATERRRRVEDVFKFAATAKDWFPEASLEDKNRILLSMGSNFILKDKTLLIEWKKPIGIFRKNKVNKMNKEKKY